MAFSPENLKSWVESREFHAFIQTATYPPFTKGILRWHHADGCAGSMPLLRNSSSHYTLKVRGFTPCGLPVPNVYMSAK